MTPRLRALVLGSLATAGLAAPTARAWDPGTTHQGLTDRAVLASRLHVRWMEASGMERGLFTPLRLDPERLDPDLRRLLLNAVKRSHSGAGARPRGGPGACPPPSAPPETRRTCVAGDLWETTALGWIRLGVTAEAVPSARLVHHFHDPSDPTAPVWSDRELPAGALRYRQSRSNGASLASSLNRSGFSGTGASAAAWLRDADDLLAPAALYRHLAAASLSPSSAERDHNLALALVCTGALLHVVQDSTVPAHARGDLSAFFAPLSDVTGDRGLPLQEYARVQYGRSALPRRLALGARDADPGQGPADGALSPTLLGHMAGDGAFEGTARFTAGRFLSESSVPAPRRLDEALSPAEAAAKVLEGTGIDPLEARGAVMTGWPSAGGYLLTGTGRPLAAYEVDTRDRVTFHLDRVVYRDQLAHLLPLAVDASRSVLALLWGEQATVSAEANALELSLHESVERADITVFSQDADGQRRVLEKTAGAAGTHRLARPEGTCVVVVTGTLAGGAPFVLERTVAGEAGESDAPGPAPRKTLGTKGASQTPPARALETPEAGEPAPEGDRPAEDAAEAEAPPAEVEDSDPASAESVEPAPKGE